MKKKKEKSPFIQYECEKSVSKSVSKKCVTKRQHPILVWKYIFSRNNNLYKIYVKITRKV